MSPSLFKNRKLALITSLVFIFLAHSSYIFNGFVWLDHGDIERSRSLLPLSRLPVAFFTRFGTTGFYRPLVTVLNSLDFAVYQLNPAGFHLTNVLLHVAVSYIAAEFLSLLFTLKLREKILSMLIIGLHPVTALPVGVISYRQELLLALFNYSSLYFFIKLHQSKKLKTALVSAVLFLFALLSKETAILLIPVLIILKYGGQSVSAGFRNLKLRSYLSYLTALILYLLLRFFSVPEIWRTSAYLLPLPEAVGTRLFSIARLIFRLISPFPANISDSAPVVSLTNPAVLSVSILMIASFYFLFRIKIIKNIRLSFILLCLYLLPALNIIPLPRFYSPHYAYLALPFFTSLIILLLRFMPSFSASVIYLWLAIAAFSTFKSGTSFKNDFTLFSPRVALDDNFLEGHQYLGDYFFRRQQFSLSIRHYRRALQPKNDIIAFVDEGSVMNNLAGVYFAQKNYSQAEKTLLELSRKPGWQKNPKLLYNLSLIEKLKNSP